MGRAIVAGGKPAMAAPVTGIPASDLAVGSTVKLMENGSPVEYLVVHNGLPSSMYDASCDGLWLLRKDIYEERQWHSSASNSYKASTIHSYLNSTFLGLFDADTQAAIRQSKIPYVNGTGASAVASGANGLSTKVFLLGGYEIGWTQSTGKFPIDGACLSYFSGIAAVDNKRIAYLNGSAKYWWLRSPNTSVTNIVWHVNSDANIGSRACNNVLGIRPALILPKTAIFDEETMTLKGVA